MKTHAIVVIGEEIEVFNNFKKACLIKGLPYHTLKVKSFPMEFAKFTIYKKVMI